jgi:hypothetical protein
MNILWLIMGSLLFLVVAMVFFTFCAWVGHLLVRILTLGKVNLDWQHGVEPWLTQEIGFFVLLLIAGLIAAAVQR